MNLSPKAKETKAKINKQGLIKLKSFCIAKETMDKMKRQPTEWKRRSANDMADKRLQLNIKKNNLLKKRAEDQNRHFSKKIYGWPTGTRKDAPYC